MFRPVKSINFLKTKTSRNKKDRDLTCVTSPFSCCTIQVSSFSALIMSLYLRSSRKRRFAFRFFGSRGRVISNWIAELYEDFLLSQSKEQKNTLVKSQFSTRNSDKIRNNFRNRDKKQAAKFILLKQVRIFVTRNFPLK